MEVRMPARTTNRTAAVLLVVALATAGVAAVDSQSKGRYKKEGAICIWDVNDSGPNQCMPLTPGRFKKDGDRCVWSGTDVGADQCRPPQGRFKKEGTACVWNAQDGGPDQCNPKRAVARKK
jgi:hypothetical protein